MSVFYRIPPASKPTIRDKAVILSKFRCGLDLSMLADGLDYTAFDQIATRTGSDNSASWNLERTRTGRTDSRQDRLPTRRGFGTGRSERQRQVDR